MQRGYPRNGEKFGTSPVKDCMIILCEDWEVRLGRITTKEPMNQETKDFLLKEISVNIEDTNRQIEYFTKELAETGSLLQEQLTIKAKMLQAMKDIGEIRIPKSDGNILRACCGSHC